MLLPPWLPWFGLWDSTVSSRTRERAHSLPLWLLPRPWKRSYAGRRGGAIDRSFAERVTTEPVPASRPGSRTRS
jgi:hypothetical protein